MYRLVDLVAIAFLFFLILESRQETFEADSWIILSIGLIIFNITAEALDLYRSWRTQSTTILIKYTAIAWLVTSSVIVVFSYFFPELAKYDEIVILTWIFSTFPALAAWRIVFREILFIQS
jgi:putative colanic acid biosynthesis UDP-glucose lipid carrier transferase